MLGTRDKAAAQHAQPRAAGAPEKATAADGSAQVMAAALSLFGLCLHEPQPSSAPSPKATPRHDRQG